MEISTLLVHRLRGRHYATFDHCTSYLPGPRKTIIQDIPTNPNEFQGNQGQLPHSPLLPSASSPAHTLPLPLPLPFSPVLSTVPT